MWDLSTHDFPLALSAAVIACGVVGFLCAVFLLLLLAYRMKKKDEGSYDLGDTKLSNTQYHKAPTKEFYAWTDRKGLQMEYVSNQDWEYWWRNYRLLFFGLRGQDECRTSAILLLFFIFHSHFFATFSWHWPCLVCAKRGHKWSK